ncbi:glutathione hydrolase 1 proenzyme isoform X2 [Hydra vulgaris]|uniref:Glutathione hydrolase 1 proenzyme isoform X2 n=1 Tax=Hydra vulgaris TaxID=6087 RepID=A0ABM4CQB9_HYDVU
MNSYEVINGNKRSNLRKWIFGILAVAIVIIIIIVIAVVVKKKTRHHKDPSKSFQANEYDHAAVAADSRLCSEIGVDILKKKGSAVDSAIATTLCLCVVQVHSTGIGGGGFMVVYERAKKKFFVYDFRESAPAGATESMFVNQPSFSLYGGMAVGIPGMIKGLLSAHANHGHLKWSELVQPSLKLAVEGFPLPKILEESWKKTLKKPNISQALKDLFTRNDGKWLEEGDLFINKALGKTLSIIKDNPKDFYEGDLAKQIVKDIQNGIITLDDLKSYTVKTPEILSLKLQKNNLTLNTMGLPSGGPVLAMITNIISGYDLSKVDFSNHESQTAFYHKLIESMKFGYAQRGLLGDADFLPAENITKVLSLMLNSTIALNIRRNKIWLNSTHPPSYYGGSFGKDDFGTTHLSVLAENGDAVSCTNTINTYFGSLLLSNTTGILYNNEMDDFSTPGVPNAYGYPPSAANFIHPGKRPLSSMSPSIITDGNGDVKMVVGASGGSQIISAVLQVLLRKIFFNQELGFAVNGFRLHDQGVPNEILYDTPPKHLLDGLRELGHKSKSGLYNVVQAIYKDKGKIYAASDPRKGGLPGGY